MSNINVPKQAITASESRAARNYFGMSQAQVAKKSGLNLNKLKRFELQYAPVDNQFVQDLREFLENEGYNFNDEDSPGAKAKANGDVFQAGVIGETGSSTGETDGFTAVQPGKLPRPEKANLQYMRITPSLDNSQIDRVFDCIEENETAISEESEKVVATSFLESGPSTQSQAKAIALLRRLAENGLLYARLMGRDLLPIVEDEATKKDVQPPRPRLFGSSIPAATGNWKTIGDLLQAAMRNVQVAVIDGDKEAQALRKARTEPTEVLQALVS